MRSLLIRLDVQNFKFYNQIFYVTLTKARIETLTLSAKCRMLKAKRRRRR